MSRKIFSVPEKVYENRTGQYGSLILAAHRNVRRAEAAAMIMRFDLAA